MSCGKRLKICPDDYYSEVHHIRPLGGVHAGADMLADEWDFDPAILSEISKQMGISLDRYEG